MKRLIVFRAVLALLLFSGLALFTACQRDGGARRSEVTFWMADYDGLRGGFMTALEEAFEEAHPEYSMDLVMVDWDNMLDKLTTSFAANIPPDASVVGTRWILDFMAMDAIDEPTKYVSEETLGNIAPGAMEAKLDGVLMGLPFAAGSRFLAINGSLTSTIPKTMEELRAAAIKATTANSYGLIMPGGKHTELTDFCYYFYAAGGEYFDNNGRCTVNAPAGVKALEFMVKLANEDRVVQKGFVAQDRKQSHPVFFAGKAAYVMIGAWADSEYKKVGAEWPILYSQIPPFGGSDPAPLIITDSVAIYKNGKNKEGVGKFIDFMYQDEWKAVMDEQMGFPPVTISASKLPQFQTPMYQAMAEANLNAKGWPLVVGWAETSSIIWDAVQKAYLKEMSPKEALDWAAAEVDKVRGK